jgi:methyl-accepting chemotaxis protein WspA
VFDENNGPVAAAWKASSQILTADELPSELDLEGATLLTIDSIQDDQKVGHVEAYYTDAHLLNRIKAARAVAAARETAFRENSQKRLRNTIAGQLIGVGIILIALITSLMLFLRGLIQKPLRKIARVARQLSDLDLTVRLKARNRDEVGTLFLAIDEMVQSFMQTVSLMQQSGHQVYSSATQLAVTAEQHEQTMTTQVESTNRAAQSVENISIITGQLVQTIQQVTSMAQETTEFANRGQSDLFRMEEAMRNMETASTSISEKLETINAKADRITDVVTTINKVSEQTNLLSLNASIEAEKAGEYGRGFSVVAREIRRLADQTAVSTLDIGRMVQEMQSAVATGVMEMDKFIKDVQRSTEDVGRISMQLTLIIDQVQALSPNFENVSVAVQQQSEDAQEISSLMESLSHEMLQTREALHESFGAIEQLKEAARGLQEEVLKFQVQ